jgi:hypothetical protein
VARFRDETFDVEVRFKSRSRIDWRGDLGNLGKVPAAKQTTEGLEMV